MNRLAASTSVVIIGEAATAGRDDDAGEARDIAPDRIIGSELPMPADALDRVVTDDADDAPGEAPGVDRDREGDRRR